MIKLSLDAKSIDSLNKELNLKVQAIGEMTSPTYTQEMAKAVFTLVSEKFVLAADRYAVRNPKKMHHVYEWGKIGNPRARLFIMQRDRILGGNLQISSKFKISKTKVPINPELLIPGKTGKYVSRRSVFRNKADIMEMGIPINFQANRVLSFMGRNGQQFMQPGKIIHIQNPGGIATRNAFSQFMLTWYNENAQKIMDNSGLYEKIANEASIILNKNGSTSAQMKKSLFNTMGKVSKGKVVVE